MNEGWVVFWEAQPLESEIVKILRLSSYVNHLLPYGKNLMRVKDLN